MHKKTMTKNDNENIDADKKKTTQNFALRGLC